MARPYWLLSLIPVIGGPLAFWLQNRAVIGRAIDDAGRGYRAGGLGGGLVGVAEGFGHDEGTDAPNALGESIEQAACDPSADPRLHDMLRSIDVEPSSPK